ncbi:MAG TPA: HlyD family efflux transporter periplasmic adaptor subunit [Polyangiaceae bacterium]
MIKNPPAALAAGAVTFALGLGACHRGPEVPPGFQGVVEYDQRVIGFEVPGRIEQVAVQRGDLVKTGQLLAKLDDTLQRLTVDSRQKDQAAAEADLALLLAGSRREDIASGAADMQGAMATEDQARKENDRVRRLVADGALPQSELDKADADLQRSSEQRKALEQKLIELRKGSRPEEIARSRARVDQARSLLALEQERLVRYTLSANADSEVVDVEVKAGELAVVGSPAVTLADTAHPYVDVFVPEGSMNGVRLGAPATVRVDMTSAPFPAKVEYVSPETEFTPKFLFSDRERPHLVVRVRVRVDDPDRRLQSGLPAFATVAP